MLRNQAHGSFFVTGASAPVCRLPATPAAPAAPVAPVVFCFVCVFCVCVCVFCVCFVCVCVFCGFCFVLFFLCFLCFLCGVIFISPGPPPLDPFLRLTPPPQADLPPPDRPKFRFFPIPPPPQMSFFPPSGGRLVVRGHGPPEVRVCWGHFVKPLRRGGKGEKNEFWPLFQTFALLSFRPAPFGSPPFNPPPLGHPPPFGPPPLGHLPPFAPPPFEHGRTGGAPVKSRSTLHAQAEWRHILAKFSIQQRAHPDAQKSLRKQAPRWVGTRR